MRLAASVLTTPSARRHRRSQRRRSPLPFRPPVNECVSSSVLCVQSAFNLWLRDKWRDRRLAIEATKRQRIFQAEHHTPPFSAVREIEFCEGVAARVEAKPAADRSFREVKIFRPPRDVAGVHKSSEVE